jgi:transmembrane sensor
MSEQETASEIDAAAAEWAVKREARGADPAFAADLDAWLAGDPRRVGALLRAEAALSLLNRARALSGEARQRGGARIGRRELAVGGGLAALAAGLGAIAVLVPGGRRFGTALGEVRKVPLDDGSVAAINTESRVQVEMKPQIRRVTLAKGEVWFKVAKDARRPFVVEAGEVRVRAVGTAFSVRRRDNGADVLVTEGVVATWVVGHEDREIRVSAGSRAFVSEDQPPQAVEAKAEIDNALAWRDGQVALYGETLADAAAEFNRYNARKIVIPDPRLASEKVVGQFRTDDPEAFAQAAASTLGARVVADNSTLRLYREAKR